MSFRVFLHVNKISGENHLKITWYLWKETPEARRAKKVMLAASELGPYIPGIGQAYHTSVLIDNEESVTQVD